MELRGVLREPEQVEGISVKCQHDDRSPRHSPQLPQSFVEVAPLVHGDQRHRGVHATVVERQLLGDAANRRGEMSSALHRMAADGSTARTYRSSGSYDPVPAQTFSTVRASPRAGRSRGNPRVGSTLACVTAAMCGVVYVAGRLWLIGSCHPASLLTAAEYPGDAKNRLTIFPVRLSHTSTSPL